MKSLLGYFDGFKNKKEEELKNKEKKLIMTEVGKIRRKINRTENWFNNETDRDMLEASIYYKKFLESKLRFLTRLAKIYKISLN